MSDCAAVNERGLRDSATILSSKKIEKKMYFDLKYQMSDSQVATTEISMVLLQFNWLNKNFVVKSKLDNKFHLIKNIFHLHNYIKIDDMRDWCGEDIIMQYFKASNLIDDMFNTYDVYRVVDKKLKRTTKEICFDCFEDAFPDSEWFFEDAFPDSEWFY